MPALTLDQALQGYAQGIFPMAGSRDDPEIHLIDPPRRGVLPLDDLDMPRRLGRLVRSDRFEVRVDTAFAQVVGACAAPAPGREDTWINPPIQALYLELHLAGHAHSVECWREDRLVGGLYGVALHGAFFGESMFSRERDASKVALVHLVARLKVGGFSLLDTQFLTPHLAQFNGIEISQTQYQRRLGAALCRDADFGRLQDPSGAAAWQAITQAS